MESVELKKLIANNTEYLILNKSLFEIYNDNLTHYLKQSIIAETKTESARYEIFARLNTTNILKKIVNKLSKSYNTNVLRKYFDADEEKKKKVQEIIESFEDIYDIDYVMKLADILININGTVLFEINEENIQLYPAHQFLYIKDILIIIEETKIKVIKDSNIYIYDNDYRLLSSNPLTYNPYIVANKSLFLEQPFPDYDTMHMTLLLPLMLTDLNFALRFQSHSIIYGINIEAKELAMTPNSFWSFKSNDDNKPELGTINPTVDADKMLSSIKEQFLLWLDTKNIKVNSVDGSSLSGVAKAIDNASVEEQIEENQRMWKRIEYLVWENMYKLHNIDLDYIPTIVFLDNRKPTETNKERIENLILLLNNNLKTKRQVLQELNTELLNEEIDILLGELNKNSLEAKIAPLKTEDTNISKVFLGG